MRMDFTFFPYHYGRTKDAWRNVFVNETFLSLVDGHLPLKGQRFSFITFVVNIIVPSHIEIFWDSNSFHCLIIEDRFENQMVNLINLYLTPEVKPANLKQDLL